MATLHVNPFAQFNFLIHLWGSGNSGPHAGFQECNGAGVDFAVAEYHKGHHTGDTTHRIMGLHKFGDLTLKRGVVSGQDFSQWIDAVRQSSQGALRNVTIRLQNEDRSEAVQAWRLVNARILKHVSGAMNAGRSEVAMEELTLAYERIEVGE